MTIVFILYYNFHIFKNFGFVIIILFLYVNIRPLRIYSGFEKLNVYRYIWHKIKIACLNVINHNLKNHLF